MVKRIVSFILTLAMVLCFMPALADDDVVTLKLWAGVQPEYGYDQVEASFNEQFKEKGIQVEYVRYVNNTDGNLQLDTYLMSGGDVDIFVNYGGLTRLTPRKEANLVLGLKELVEAKGFNPVEELGETNLTTCTIDGDYYALPTKYENNQWMFINVDMFNEAEIEIPYNGWTYEQFREAAKKLTHGEGLEKVYGIYWNLTYGNMILGINFMNNYLGDYAIYKDLECTETNFDDPQYLRGMQLIVDTMLVDGSAPTYADEVANGMTFDNLFLEGYAAMAMGIANIRLVKDLQNYPHDFTTALVPAPVPDESYLAYYGDHGNVATGIGDTICISSKTQHVDECVDFVLWYIRGGMAPLAKGGRLPLWSGVNPDDVVAALMDGAKNVFDTQSVLNYLAIDKSKISVTPDRPQYALAEINTVMEEELQFAMSGVKTCEQTLADMKSRGDELIRQAMSR